MRRFLEKHSSLYKWAIREEQELVASHARLTRSLATDLSSMAREKSEQKDTYEALLGEAKSANLRLRRANRDLVSALRKAGIPAGEWPAERCPNCGSLAAFPEDGKHQTGTVAYGDRKVRLFCDGSEE